MPKHNIPVYAIVELLMLLAQQDTSVGDYRGHTIRNNQVLVKTTGGSIIFSEALIMKQFSEPENITKIDLMNALSLYKPTRFRRSA